MRTSSWQALPKSEPLAVKKLVARSLCAKTASSRSPIFSLTIYPLKWRSFLAFTAVERKHRPIKPSCQLSTKDAACP
jgi:hypothetical protein